MSGLQLTNPVAVSDTSVVHRKLCMGYRVIFLTDMFQST